MPSLARKVILPKFEKTSLANEDDLKARQVNIELEGNSKKVSYFVQPILTPESDNRRDGKPIWMPTQFNLYPIVLNGDGSP